MQEKIKDLHVVLTMVDGQFQYRKDPT